MRALCILLALGFVTILSSEGALAVDGVNQIDNTSIIAAGGYPYTIPAHGSYRLTGDLTPPAGTEALVAGAKDIEIDLNGFTIVSPGGGAANGIDSAGFAGLVVRNGLVSGFGGAGILAGPNSKVIDTKLSGNDFGVSGGTNCLIWMNTIHGNTGNGLNAVTQCKIENNAIAGNTGAGISGGANVIANNEITGNLAGGILEGGMSTIQQNVILGNTGFGISDGAAPGPAPFPPPVGPRTNIVGNSINFTAAGGAVGGRGISFLVPVSVTDNTINNNATDGVVCGCGCAVSGNSVTTNNTTGGAASGGVTVAAGSAVSGNSISFNTGFGLTLPAPPSASYTNNAISFNTAAQVVSPPTLTGAAGNVCFPAACP